MRNQRLLGCFFFSYPFESGWRKYKCYFQLGAVVFFLTWEQLSVPEMIKSPTVRTRLCAEISLYCTTTCFLLIKHPLKTLCCMLYTYLLPSSSSLHVCTLWKSACRDLNLSQWTCCSCLSHPVTSTVCFELCLAVHPPTITVKSFSCPKASHLLQQTIKQSQISTKGLCKVLFCSLQKGILIFSQQICP